MKGNKLIGVGSSLPRVVLHIANRPPVDGFEGDIDRPLQISEAAGIIKQTGNHWRKVFSILAKMSFALFDTGCKTWQEYRDTKLLTDQGFEYLCFSNIRQTRLTVCRQPETTGETSVSIVCGFAYAQTQLDLTSLISHQNFEKLKWSEQDYCLITPYFDWRQLNNEMLAVAVKILASKLLIENVKY